MKKDGIRSALCAEMPSSRPDCACALLVSVEALVPTLASTFFSPRIYGGEMAKESSFDVVSEVDMMEVDNAFQQA